MDAAGTRQQPRRRGMLKKLIPIEQNPTIVYFAQQPFFKIVMVAVFAFFIMTTDTFSPLWGKVVIATIAAITIMPRYRYIILFCGMYTLMLNNALIREQPDWMVFRVNYYLLLFKKNISSDITSSFIKYIDIALMVVISEILIYLTTYHNKIKLFRYPITIYIILLLALILTASYAPVTLLQSLLIWSLIAVLNHYFWFVCYTLHETRFMRKRNYLLDYARYLPVWGFTSLPYGKGSIYLEQVEAKTSEEFAVTQLKGLKLVFWAYILYWILQMYHEFELTHGLPRLQDALEDYSNGLHYTAWKAWLCLIDKFFRMMLELTVMGHYFVACCRMCGFRILRNTYKPLQAKSIAEYWNRYNYYFKELLVEFFFYPTFFKFFKKMPRLRMFFATMGAATFGNIVFHFFLLTPIMMSSGFVAACRGFISYTIYAIILGVSIGFSQLHNLNNKRKPNKIMDTYVSPIIVLLFYCLLALFNAPYEKVSVVNNFKFLGSLFGMTW
jgi:hypothetical protein